jgi:hypothetical protein
MQKARFLTGLFAFFLLLSTRHPDTPRRRHGRRDAL